MSNNNNAVVDNATIPPVPEDWGRCHAYNEFKRRYCRQMPVPLSGEARCIGADRPRYCGNHMHLLEEERNDDKDRGRRVPCPIDPSHLIFEGSMSKHILICPAVKRRQDLAGKEYFREGINLGGFGSMGSAASSDGGSESGGTVAESEEAKRLAYAVLRVFHRLFLSGGDNGASKHCLALTDRQLQSISESDIYDALPENDLSWVEEEEEEETCIVAPPPSSAEEEEARGGGDDHEEANRTRSRPGRLTSTIARHRVSAGGPRHLRQIASILGHARREGLISTTKTKTKTKTKTMTTNEAGTTPETADATYPLIVEMGAGRGMTGLVVAGAMAASSSLSSKSSSRRVSLCLVERSGTRRKAETRVRTAEGYSARDCLRLDLVDITRVKCDLADVDMPRALESQLRRSPVDFSRTVVIAKHLCGVGTDLAIMSIRNLGGSIDGCVMATCCHGLCSWNDYVGRDCLLALFQGDESGGLEAFGEGQFNTLKRWTSAAVSVERPPASSSSSSSSSSGNNDNDTRESHYAGGHAEEGLRSNIFALSKELGLACGGKGLGRACQRLIDYGRCEYLRGRGFTVKLCHYVPRVVTPQNALIVASR